MRSRLLVATLVIFLGGALGPLCQVACAQSEASPQETHAGAADGPCHEAPAEAGSEVGSAAQTDGCSTCLRAASLLAQERLTSLAHPQPIVLAAAPAPEARSPFAERRVPILPRARAAPHLLFLKHASLLL